MSFSPKYALLACIAFGPIVSTSMAQEEYFSRDKYEAVTDRRQPEFDPEPIRLGVFEVRSEAHVGLTANSNVFASGTNDVSDLVARFGGAVDARTNWSNHEVQLKLGAYRNEYLDIGDESNNDLRALARGRLDVSRNFAVAASVFAEQRSEPRQDFANAVGIDGPVEFGYTGAQLEANYKTGRLRLDSSLRLAKTDFDDANIIGSAINFDQDYRDRTLTTARGRLSYAVTPNFALFGQGSAYQSEYDTARLVSGALRVRDSDGYTASVGANFELSALVRGDIAVGYLSDDKSDPIFSDVSGLSVDGQMIWFPTQLTNVTLEADRRVVDLGLIESPTALATGFGVRLDHELKRNIILSAYTRLEQHEYDDIARTDDLLNLTLSGTYKVNKKVHIEAFIRQIGRDVSGTTTNNALSHDINLIGIGVKFSP